MHLPSSESRPASPAPADNANDLGTHDAEPAAQETGADSPTLRRWLQRRCYGFEIGGYHLMVQQGTFCELLASFRVSPLPNAPDYLLGLTNLRGNLLPIYQLEGLLGLAQCAPNYALLIGDALTSAAIAISSKPQQFDLASLEPVGAPTDIPQLLTKVVLQSFRHEARVWSVLDHTQLFQLLASGQAGAGN